MVRQVSFAPQVTGPVEDDLNSLRQRLALFNSQIDRLDAEIQAAKSALVDAMAGDGTDDDVMALTTKLRDLETDRANVLEAGRIAAQRIDDQKATLKEAHDVASQHEANRRFSQLAPAAKALDDAVAAANRAAADFNDAVLNVRKVAPHFMKPATTKSMFSRYLFAMAPALITLAGDLRIGITRPKAGPKSTDTTPLATLFADDPAKRPFPTIQKED